MRLIDQVWNAITLVTGRKVAGTERVESGYKAPVRVIIVPTHQRSCDRVISEITAVFAQSEVHASVDPQKKYPCGAVEVAIRTPISADLIGRINAIEGVTSVRNLHPQLVP